MSAQPNMKLTALKAHPHDRGTLFEAAVDGKTLTVLVTSHALDRARTWRLPRRAVLQSLLLPEEVLRGHRNRFIAHRRRNSHVVRVVYEYEGTLPVVVTVYNPLAKRYFEGRGRHEDRILT